MAESMGFENLQLRPSKGRQTRDPNINVDNIPTFVTRTVPPVDNKTRIIAVCGIPDSTKEFPIYNWEEGGKHSIVQRGRCDQIAEGWFVADTYAFMSMYENTCAAQTWIHSEKPQDLVNKYGTYVHGDPYKDRKEVLSQAMLDQGFAKDFTVVPRTQLKQRFCQQLKVEAETARKLGQSLLVLTMSHGDEETHAVNLGERDVPGDWFTVEDFRNAVALGVSRGAAATDLKITYVSTACYSGGWTVMTDINLTIFAAAGPDRESLSWLASPSCGRYSGAVMCTALRLAWEEESKAAETINETVSVPGQERTLAEFTGEIYDSLYRIDKEAHKHDIRFSAQDDDWETAWTQRSGFSLASFHQKWDSLKTCKTTAPPDALLNPSPSNKLNSSIPVDVARGSFSRRFEFASAAREFVLVIADRYMSSFPGPNNTANNGPLHSLIQQVRDNKVILFQGSLDAIYYPVQFRLSMAHQATWLLNATGIPLPNGQRCNEWDETNFREYMRNFPEDSATAKWNLAVRVIFQNVLPNADKRLQGMRWNKPNHYIAAALACDVSIKNQAKLDAAIRRLETAAKEDIKRVSKDVECYAEIRGRKKDLFARIGKRVKSLSPDRIRRKRASTVGVGQLGSVPETFSPSKSYQGKGTDPVKF
ncbi:hypothetical protein M3J09_013378 [Ascochyta lentis]